MLCANLNAYIYIYIYIISSLASVGQIILMIVFETRCFVPGGRGGGGGGGEGTRKKKNKITVMLNYTEKCQENIFDLINFVAIV